MAGIPRIGSARPGAQRSLALAALISAGLSSGCQDDARPEQDGGTTTSDAATTTTGADESTGPEMVDPNAPTWYQDIAPTVVAKCGGCHREGGIATFSLADYEAAAPLAPIVAASVEEGRMPPFAADDTDECQMNHGWKDDLRLSDEEKQALRAWADAAAPEGDPATAAPIPEAPQVQLTTADLHLEMEGSVAIGGIFDEFLCFSLDPQLTEDRYLSALQVVPGNDRIVHHVLVYVDETGGSADLAGPDGSFECDGGDLQGQLIGAWAPGALPARPPEGSGMLVPAGARLVMNVHYHPTGGGDEIDDATAIDIDWLDEVPAWRAELALVGNGDGLVAGPNDQGGIEFRIPANASGHTETMLYTIPNDIPELRLWGIGAHMHYVGVDMFIGVQRQTSPGPSQECLLHTPTYSFEWQRLYSYDVSLDDAPRLQGGDQLYMRCIYENTLNNPGVAEALGQQGLDEPIDVYLGEETLDEMCLGIYGIAVPSIF
ncbi:hypothetical protein [Paraliomyxa miuraensis]|uniref:hypothetical protein n=1 Tax=Paraliomyxa miuraensis TaxID=376150 RepID=UPI002250D20A|nr:hypothetical protein [Paraliomyxa miuraensis]MCX4240894.1 hypothetical protein [Paraliomyxa miuraensis]